MILIRKTCLVFGASGQDGSLICKSLLEKGFQVVGIARSQERKLKNHIKLGIEKDVEIKKGDIKSLQNIEKIISCYQPEMIFNLAAQSSVGKSFIDPINTIQSIVDGTLNILEATRKMNYSGRIFFAGSSEMFGNTEKKADINHKQNPISPYAIGKQSSYNLVKLYRKLHNLKCMTGILFNHESHLRDKHFVTQKIITSANQINNKRNKGKKIKMGNINIVRDWGWAPEYIEAIQIITNSKTIKDYVICTGNSYSLETFIQKVFEFYNLEWKEHIEIDKNLFRPNEINISKGDPNPLFEDLGWKADINLESLINKLILYSTNT